MILNSIKWRLQAWHALMLIVVLAGFGITAYQLDRVSRFQRIDRELQQRGGVIMAALRAGEGPRGRPPHEGGGPPPGDPQGDFPPRRGPNDDRPPPHEGTMSSDPGPARGPRLSARDQSLFETNNASVFYYVLWHREGWVLSKSDSAPPDVIMPARGGSNNVTRTQGNRRELLLFMPPGERIVAGVDVSAELAELRRLGWLLFGAGGGVLLLGLAGGWWMASRAIHPIADISATAVKISSGDLSQRIPAADADNELGQLAGVLNSTFSRLETAFTQQRQFTSDAAHELRTPVAVILTQVQSALNKERSGPEYRETLEACQRAAQRMRRLIESLLALARLDAGQEPLKRTRFDLSATARDCVALIRPLAEQRGVKIIHDLPAVECEGDAERFAQVITNLLTNAIQYNKEGGEVRVMAQTGRGGAVLSVTDTGAGISAEDLPRVFERFFRADKSRTGSTGNAGLGLAISKAIVEAHGGGIEVASSPGAGTTFTIRLPRAD